VGPFRLRGREPDPVAGGGAGGGGPARVARPRHRPPGRARPTGPSGRRAGWGLAKPPPASVAGMAEGSGAPSHELRGSWAPAQGGRPGDPGQTAPRCRQPTWLRRLQAVRGVAGFPRKGELCPPSTTPPSVSVFSARTVRTMAQGIRGLTDLTHARLPGVAPDASVQPPPLRESTPALPEARPSHRAHPVRLQAHDRIRAPRATRPGGSGRRRSPACAPTSPLQHGPAAAVGLVR
jgi:hypothetical protein